MYKRIITYTFEHDEARASFTELLLGLGFEEQPDQSTYAQKDRNPQHLDELKDVITDWSHDENLSEDDSIQIYFLVRISEKQMLIERHDMNYNDRHSDIR